MKPKCHFLCSFHLWHYQLVNTKVDLFMNMPEYLEFRLNLSHLPNQELTLQLFLRVPEGALTCVHKSSCQKWSPQSICPLLHQPLFQSLLSCVCAWEALSGTTKEAFANGAYCEGACLCSGSSYVASLPGTRAEPGVGHTPQVLSTPLMEPYNPQRKQPSR